MTLGSLDYGVKETRTADRDYSRYPVGTRNLLVGAELRCGAARAALPVEGSYASGRAP